MATTPLGLISLSHSERLICAVSALQLVRLYRECQAKHLHHDTLTDDVSTRAVAVLSIFPEIFDRPDLLELLEKVWKKKIAKAPRRARRQLAFRRELFANTVRRA